MSPAPRSARIDALQLGTAEGLAGALASSTAPFVQLSVQPAPVEAAHLKRLPPQGFVLIERGPLAPASAWALRWAWGLEPVDVGGRSLWRRADLLAALEGAEGRGWALHAELLRRSLLRGAEGARVRPSAGAAPVGAGLGRALLGRFAPLGWALLSLFALAVLIPRHALSGLCLLLPSALAFGFSFGRRR